MKKILLFLLIVGSLTLYDGLFPSEAYATHTYNRRMVNGLNTLSYCNGNNPFFLGESGPDAFFTYYTNNYDEDPNPSLAGCYMVTFGINTADGTVGSAYSSTPTLSWKSNFQAFALTDYTIKFWINKIFFWQGSTGGLIDISDGKVNPNTGQPFTTMELDCNGGNHSTDGQCGYQTPLQSTPYTLTIPAQATDQKQLLSMTIPSGDFSGSFTSGQIPGTPPSPPCNLNKGQGYYQLDYDIYDSGNPTVKIGGGFNFIRISGSPCAPSTPPAIQSLGVGNATSGQTSITGPNKVSGRIQADNGSNWLNPERIRLTVNPGSSLTIKAYYVAFYDQSLGLQTETTFLTNIKSALTTDPSKGILLAYGHPDEIVGSGGSSTKKYYVFDSAASPQWQDITSNTPPYAVNSSTTYYIAESNTGLTDERAAPYTVGWTITFKPPFGNRTMFTGAFVKDMGNLTSFFAELSPTILP